MQEMSELLEMQARSLGQEDPLKEGMVSQFSCSVEFDSLWPHGLQHTRPPCPSATPGVDWNSCPLSQWCHPTISSSVIPFSSRLQSFPASESFQMSQVFASSGQSTGDSASTSVLPMTIQGWFPLGWTGLIFLHSKGHSKVLITVWNTTSQFESISSSVFSLLYGATLTSVHNYWKNHSFDFTDLYRQSNVSAF